MKKVLVGMSGGVDSSTAALLLLKKGYEVAGLTVRTCRDHDTPWEIDEVAQAARACESLGIRHFVRDYDAIFEKRVTDYFTDSWFSGRTPNPCIVCNREVKWRGLIETADEQGFDLVSTGHYARIRRLENGRFAPALSVSAKKDQSYVLFMLKQDMLSRTVLPVGEFEKPRIRAIAEEAGLPCAHTPDSQDICFVSGHDYAGFLRERSPERIPGPGRFLSAAEPDKVLGEHKGYIHYTVGQRKGLGISAASPLYVSKISPQTNEVFLSDSDVYGDELEIRGVNFLGLAPDAIPVGASGRFVCKIRYSHAGSLCLARRTGEDSFFIKFDEPVRAITPGQAAVLYEDGAVMLGGFIE